MPQLTLSVPQEKLPILQDFLYTLGIDDKNTYYVSSDNSSNNNIQREPSTLNKMFKTYFGWEYFCNELEFE